MDKTRDVDLEPQGFEDGTAERTEPGMPEDVFDLGSDRAMHRCVGVRGPPPLTSRGSGGVDGASG